MIYNTMSGVSTIRDYKTVDRDSLSSPLQGNIYVDCVWQGYYLGLSTYVIAIGGTVF